MGNKPLSRLAVATIDEDSRNLRTRDLWEVGSGWKWHNLSPLLPQQVIHQLEGTRVLEEEERDDAWAWLDPGSINFRVKNTCEIEENWGVMEKWEGWRKIWRRRV